MKEGIIMPKDYRNIPLEQLNPYDPELPPSLKMQLEIRAMQQANERREAENAAKAAKQEELEREKRQFRHDWRVTAFDVILSGIVAFVVSVACNGLPPWLQ